MIRTRKRTRREREGERAPALGRRATTRTQVAVAGGVSPRVVAVVGRDIRRLPLYVVRIAAMVPPTSPRDGRGERPRARPSERARDGIPPQSFNLRRRLGGARRAVLRPAERRRDGELTPQKIGGPGGEIEQARGPRRGGDGGVASAVGLRPRARGVPVADVEARILRRAFFPAPRSCHWRYRSEPASNRAMSVSVLTRPTTEVSPATADADATRTRRGGDRTTSVPLPAYATIVITWFALPDICAPSPRPGRSAGRTCGPVRGGTRRRRRPRR